MKDTVNELQPELMSVNSINPFIRWISASRLQMFGSHLTQALWVKGCSEPAIFTGVERDFGKYTYNVKFDKDSTILKRIHRYPKTLGVDSINYNPETIIIYEADKTDPESGRVYPEISYLSVPKYHSKHMNFGFEFTDVSNEHMEERFIPEGTLVRQSPTIDPDSGLWRYGLEANLAMMTIKEVIEDGYVASESFAEKCTTTCMEEYEVSFGSKLMPINHKGDGDNYKIMPDIGEYVGDDGVLMVLRRHDEQSAAVNMSKKAIDGDADYMFDECIYVEPNSRIVDIKVYHDYTVDGGIRGKSAKTPVGTTAQLEKYLNATYNFYDTIRKTYEDLKRNRGKALNISDKFNNLVYQSYLNTVGVNNDNKGLGDNNYSKAERHWRGVPIDEWRVVVTVEYPFKLSKGSKIVGRHGNKGVVTAIWPDSHMPMTKSGVVADIIADPLAMVKRSIPSTLIEQYITASATATIKRVCSDLERGVSMTEISKYVLDFYGTINADQVEYFDEDTIIDHIHHAVKRYKEGHPTGLTIHMPINIENTASKIVRSLQQNFPPEHDTVTYMSSGGYVETTKPVLIGSMYTMFLEKIGNTWAGVSSAKLNHFGIPAKITNSTKNLSPGRNQPIRFGESEVRLFVTMVGPEQTARMIDGTNNPKSRLAILNSMMESDDPLNQESLIPEKEGMYGGGRITGMVRHYLECAGRKFTRKLKVNNSI